MPRDQLEERRAARGRSGSRRQRDLAAAGIHSSENLAAEARSTARMAEWITWAEKTFPDFPQGRSIFASAGMMVKRSGRKPTRKNVLERIWIDLPHLCQEFGFPELGT